MHWILSISLRISESYGRLVSAESENTADCISYKDKVSDNVLPGESAHSDPLIVLVLVNEHPRSHSYIHHYHVFVASIDEQQAVQV